MTYLSARASSRPSDTGSRGPAFVVLALALLVVASMAACAADADEVGPGGGGSGASTGTGAGTTGTGAGGEGGGAGANGGGGAGANGGGGSTPWNGLCPTDFTFQASPGTTKVRVAGEWQGFDLGSAPVMMGPDASGNYAATVDLPPGLHAYKIVADVGADTQWLLDPKQGRRKYVDHVENSGVKVRDCSKPTLAVVDKQVTRPAPGQGRFVATLSYVDVITGGGADADGYEVSLRKDGAPQVIAASAVQVGADGDVAVDIQGLADGKYRLVLQPKAKSGALGDPVRLVFWVEAEAFSWQDALIYMVVTDRFVNGDPANDPAPTPGADPRGDWKGGDLAGLKQAIADGTLDQLGVRAIWLTPFQTNPDQAYLASDGFHMVAGYHGYWPVKAREVDARLGGEAALAAVVKEAHAHGIRILQDFVLNHVHENHEYVAAHPDWFRTGCVCGTANCDWTSHALDCMFADYMPDIDHTVPEANAQFVDDAVYWLDELDLDGLRVDAVKHVEEVATRNLAAEVRETFEGGGTRYFLMGETAMGWNDCGLQCNQVEYDTISRYIGPHGLDGQFDFVLYHAVPYRVFTGDGKGLIHADYWTQASGWMYPQGSIMTPYIGSHDTPRSVTIASYRGQDGGHPTYVPGNKWDNVATAPPDAESYARHRLALAWLLGQPGAPLLYYGDEYAEWGGADPNNRAQYRTGNALGAEELATLAFTKQLGKARQASSALRRGAYKHVYATDEVMVFARQDGANVALVALNRMGTPRTFTAPLPLTLGLADGKKLMDSLGGPDVVVSSGAVTVSLGARSAAVYLP